MQRVKPQIGGKLTSNFSVKLYRLIDIYNGPESKPVRYLELSLDVNGKISPRERIPLTQLEKTRWSELDYHAAFNPSVALAKAHRQLVSDIRTTLELLPKSRLYQLNHPGFYKIDGIPVFCTGVEVIRPPASGQQEPEIECGPMTQRLDFDPDLSEEEAAAEMFNLISLFPNPGRVILSQMLVSQLRQAYEDAGKRPSFCVFLHGPTGTQKTTIASFLTQIYNRSEGITAPPRLNASQASAVELLLNISDQVQVFDDLFPSASASVRKKQEETLSEITRYIGDGTVPARIKGNNVRSGHPRCGVLFTGEYPIGEGSDAARLLLVEMTKPDTSALSYFQGRPLTISTFYRNFIVWAINNYDEVVAYLNDWLNEYRKIDLGVHDRLRETHFFLNSAYALFLEYCGEKAILSQDEIERIHRDFLKLLDKLVREQNERVCPTTSAPPQQGHVLERIRELYRNDQLSLPKDKSQFTEGLHHGVIHTGCLCLRPDALAHFFPSMTLDDIAIELDTQEALDKPKTGFKKKISEARGNRFFCIPLSRL